MRTYLRGAAFTFGALTAAIAVLVGAAGIVEYLDRRHTAKQHEAGHPRRKGNGLCTCKCVMCTWYSPLKDAQKCACLTCDHKEGEDFHR